MNNKDNNDEYKLDMLCKYKQYVEIYPTLVN